MNVFHHLLPTVVDFNWPVNHISQHLFTNKLQIITINFVLFRAIMNKTRPAADLLQLKQCF